MLDVVLKFSDAVLRGIFLNGCRPEVPMLFTG
jgi:hypothetical protein